MYLTYYLLVVRTRVEKGSGTNPQRMSCHANVIDAATLLNLAHTYMMHRLENSRHQSITGTSTVHATLRMHTHYRFF